MSKDATKIEAAGAALRTNEGKWSKPLMAAGWTCFPSVIIERQRVLGLDPIDVNILLYLAMHWWTPDNRPHPSKATIAKALDIDPNTVRRRIAAMEKTGFIRREERRVPGQGSKTNLYHLDGLIEAARPYAEEKLQEIAEREDQRKQRVARKGKPRLRVVSKED